MATTCRVLELARNTFFFDRDGGVFRHVLHYLRLGPVSLLEDRKELEMINAAADFFGLHDLKLKIKNKKKLKLQRDPTDDRILSKIRTTIQRLFHILLEDK